MRVWNKSKPPYPHHAVYIGRGSPYGNPYTVAKYGREKALELFEKHTLPKLDIEPLRGKDLLCHCWPKRCHGHLIIEKLRSTKG